MLCSVSVVRGFQSEIGQKVTGFASDLEMLHTNSLSVPDAYPIGADADLLKSVASLPEVRAAAPTAQKMGILKTEDNFTAITLKGISEGYPADFLKRHLVGGSLPRFGTEPARNQVVLSRTQADQLGLKVGDKVYAYFFENTLKTRRLQIAALYETHLKQFDQNFAVGDFTTVGRLNDWDASQATEIEIFLREGADADAVAARLRSSYAGKPRNGNMPPDVITIRQHYPQIFSWLGVMNMNVWVILSLMAGVACFTMAGGLLILILERTNTIGVLKALGMGNARLRQTFICFALFIILRGMAIGNALAFLLLFVQKKCNLLQLDPATYYLDTVPVDFAPLPLLLVNVATLVITTLALLLPSHLISRIQAAKAIRYE